MSPERRAEDHGGSVGRRRGDRVRQKKGQAFMRLPFCPDHRDKVAGKPCRECEIERLRAERDPLVETGTEMLRWLDFYGNEGIKPDDTEVTAFRAALAKVRTP